MLKYIINILLPAPTLSSFRIAPFHVTQPHPIYWITEYEKNMHVLIFNDVALCIKIPFLFFHYKLFEERFTQRRQWILLQMAVGPGGRQCNMNYYCIENHCHTSTHTPPPFVACKLWVSKVKKLIKYHSTCTQAI